MVVFRCSFLRLARLPGRVPTIYGSGYGKKKHMNVWTGKAYLQVGRSVLLAAQSDELAA